jgi:hypothetical protein
MNVYRRFLANFAEGTRRRYAFVLCVISYCRSFIEQLIDSCFFFVIAKGRTNYELHPETYALRDGVAQTMTLFKPRLARPTCLHHQQNLFVTTPNRVN